jgi:hypothetical protein
LLLAAPMKSWERIFELDRNSSVSMADRLKACLIDNLYPSCYD